MKIKNNLFVKSSIFANNIKKFVVGNNNYINVWSESNNGSDKNIDADTIEGWHASELAKIGHSHTNLLSTDHLNDPNAHAVFFKNISGANIGNSFSKPKIKHVNSSDLKQGIIFEMEPVTVFLNYKLTFTGIEIEIFENNDLIINSFEDNIEFINLYFDLKANTEYEIRARALFNKGTFISPWSDNFQFKTEINFIPSIQGVISDNGDSDLDYNDMTLINISKKSLLLSNDYSFIIPEIFYDYVRNVCFNDMYAGYYTRELENMTDFLNVSYVEENYVVPNYFENYDEPNPDVINFKNHVYSDYCDISGENYRGGISGPTKFKNKAIKGYKVIIQDKKFIKILEIYEPFIKSLNDFHANEYILYNYFSEGDYFGVANLYCALSKILTDDTELIISISIETENGWSHNFNQKTYFKLSNTTTYNVRKRFWASSYRTNECELLATNIDGSVCLSFDNSNASRFIAYNMNNFDFLAILNQGDSQIKSFVGQLPTSQDNDGAYRFPKALITDSDLGTIGYISENTGIDYLGYKSDLFIYKMIDNNMQQMYIDENDAYNTLLFGLNTIYGSSASISGNGAITAVKTLTPPQSNVTNAQNNDDIQLLIENSKSYLNYADGQTAESMFVLKSSVMFLNTSNENRDLKFKYMCNFSLDLESTLNFGENIISNQEGTKFIISDHSHNNGILYVVQLDKFNNESNLDQLIYGDATKFGFGYKLAGNYDLSVIAVKYDNINRVDIFKFFNNKYEKVQTLYSEFSNDNFGVMISMSGDGSTLVISHDIIESDYDYDYAHDNSEQEINVVIGSVYKTNKIGVFEKISTIEDGDSYGGFGSELQPDRRKPTTIKISGDASNIFIGYKTINNNIVGVEGICDVYSSINNNYCDED